MILAEEAARTLEEAKDLYEREVRAAEASLGQEAFRKDAGRSRVFWRPAPTCGPGSAWPGACGSSARGTVRDPDRHPTLSDFVRRAVERYAREMRRRLAEECRGLADEDLTALAEADIGDYAERQPWTGS